MAAIPVTPAPVKSFTSGTVNGDEYGELLGFGPMKTPVRFPKDVPSDRRKRVIIVGAGIAGIQQAVLLLKDGHDLSSIQVFEMSDGFGGVWHKNRYPGCACDVPSLVFTSSFHVNKHWTRFFPERAEIFEYYDRMARDNKLHEVTGFRSYVRSCTWDNDEFIWKVTVQNGHTGEVEYWTANVLSFCVGELDRPKFGTTPGRETFSGDSWHTSQWPKDYDFQGKRVSIIGCGPSAAQVIPEIVDKAKSLTVYIRTSPVVVPRPDFAFAPWFTWLSVNVLGFASFMRTLTHLYVLVFMRLRRNKIDNSPHNDEMNDTARQHLAEQVKDTELRRKLEATAKYYCKRPVISNDLYPAFTKPNCTVLKESLIRYTETGIESKDEEGTLRSRECDVLIFGTGFNTAQFLEHVEVIGKDGIKLSEQWLDHPECLYGVAISNFPNLFMCSGPNSAIFWCSPQDIWEGQARLCVKACKAIINASKKGSRMAMYPKPEAERAYNMELQRQQHDGPYVWAKPDCSTIYKNDDGWLTFPAPWSWHYFLWLLRWIRWDQWERLEKRPDT